VLSVEVDVVTLEVWVAKIRHTNSRLVVNWLKTSGYDEGFDLALCGQLVIRHVLKNDDDLFILTFFLKYWNINHFSQ